MKKIVMNKESHSRVKMKSTNLTNRRTSFKVNVKVPNGDIPMIKELRRSPRKTINLSMNNSSNQMLESTEMEDEPVDKNVLYASKEPSENLKIQEKVLSKSPLRTVKLCGSHKDMHKEKLEEMINKTNNNTVSCGEKNLVIKNTAGRKRRASYSCSKCDYSTNKNNYFKRHQMIHLKVKRFQCPYCGYRTNFNCYLREHLAIHSKVRPFKCSFCNFASKSKGNIKKHENTHFNKSILPRLKNSGPIIKLKKELDKEKNEEVHMSDSDFNNFDNQEGEMTESKQSKRKSSLVSDPLNGDENVTETSRSLEAMAEGNPSSASQSLGGCKQWKEFSNQESFNSVESNRFEGGLEGKKFICSECKFACNIKRTMVRHVIKKHKGVDVETVINVEQYFERKSSDGAKFLIPCKKEVKEEPRSSLVEYSSVNSTSENYKMNDYDQISIYKMKEISENVVATISEKTMRIKKKTKFNRSGADTQRDMKKKEKFSGMFKRLNSAVQEIKKDAINVAKSGELDMASLSDNIDIASLSDNLETEGEKEEYNEQKIECLNSSVESDRESHIDTKESFILLPSPQKEPQSSKFYKCLEPQCDFVTINSINFKRHARFHLSDESGSNSNAQIRQEKLEHVMCDSSDNKGKNSLDNENEILCSICDFRSFSNLDLKRHYYRSHSNKKILESSPESLGNKNVESSNSSVICIGEIKRCSNGDFESLSNSSPKLRENTHHEAPGNELIGSCRIFKCFRCEFRTPHRITLARHERGHANFKDKHKNKNIVSSTRSQEENCRSPAKDKVRDKESKLSTFQRVQQSQDQTDYSNIKEQFTYRCCYCQFISETRDKVLSHQQKYHKGLEHVLINTLLFKCSVCEASLPSKESIKRHMLTHLNHNYNNRISNSSKITQKSYYPENDKYRKRICRNSYSEIEEKKNLIAVNEQQKDSKYVHSDDNPLNRQNENILGESKPSKYNRLHGNPQNVAVNMNKNRPNSSDSTLDVDVSLSIGVYLDKDRISFPFDRNSNEERQTFPDDVDTRFEALDNIYHCKTCFYTTHRRSLMRYHVLIHLKDKKLKCKTCPYTTNLERNFKQHELIHPQTRTFKCFSCSYKTDHLVRIWRHRQLFHK